LSFRTKLGLAFTLAVIVAVVAVAWVISASTRRAFERLENQRTSAVVGQFQREFGERSEEVARRITLIAGTGPVIDVALEDGNARSDYSRHIRRAREIAANHRLEFLELLASDATIISSAQWPARLGYKEEYLTRPAEWSKRNAFLRREELPEGSALALEALRRAHGGLRPVYVLGGIRLDQDFLASFALPPGMRIMLYAGSGTVFSPQALIGAEGTMTFPLGQNPQKLAPLVATVQGQHRELSQTISWGQPADVETFRALPLMGSNHNVMGVLLIGSSRQELAILERRIRLVALQVAAGGILLGLLLSFWATAHISRPAQRLTAAATQLAEGHWDARVDTGSKDELGQVAAAFNRMGHELIEQRERLVLSERVAATRELASRLAQELKVPLFPFQITLESLLRAHENGSACAARMPALENDRDSLSTGRSQFDEVFRESTATLLAELSNLKALIGRVGDFAKMPAPHFQPVNLNEVVESAVKLFEAQFASPDLPPISATLELDRHLDQIQADPDLLHRAVQNLVISAMGAMPSGGKLVVRTERLDGSMHSVRLEVADSGMDSARSEPERLSAPRTATRPCGTALALAIVQSVVSDHNGRITVENEPGKGRVLRIDLPVDPTSGLSQREC
jgi:two-component system nitrogen regulation sensor histidine kinase NtrY